MLQVLRSDLHGSRLFVQCIPWMVDQIEVWEFGGEINDLFLFLSLCQATHGAPELTVIQIPSALRLTATASVSYF